MRSTSRQPGVPGNWRKSFWFWAVSALSLFLFVLGASAYFLRPQVGSALLGFAISGICLAVVIALMASLRSRRRRDEQLRASP